MGDDDDEAGEFDLEGEDLEEEEPGFVVYSMLADPRHQGTKATAKDQLATRLLDEIFEPDLLRSHVITLHLYVEHWLDKLLVRLDVKKVENLKFGQKLEHLKALGAIDDVLYANVVAINRLRNVYAHRLDLEKANGRVNELLGQLKRDPYFESTDKDPLRSICMQTIMLLQATFENEGKPPKQAPFPHEGMRSKLLQAGKISWQECEILSKEEQGHDTTYILRCPLCLKGTVERDYEGTPGFRDSTLWACDVCGLSGNGSGTELDLQTAKPEFKANST